MYSAADGVLLRNDERPTGQNMSRSIHPVLGMVVCSVALLGVGPGASAASLSSGAAAAPFTVATDRVGESNNGPWLWSFLNPWAGRSDAGDGCRGIFALVDTSAAAHGCAGTPKDSSNPGLNTNQSLDLFKLLAIRSEFSGSTRDSTTTSSGPQSGPAPQAGLPAKTDVLCFKTVARLAAEGNFVDVRNYVSSLFRPPRSLV